MVNKGPIDATSYEQRLNLDPTLALREGSMHFEGESAVHATMRRLAERLERLEIPYAVVGGMAMFLHGYRRFTEDVGVLVTQQDLDTIHQQLDGLGYVRIVDGGRNLRDAELGVRVEFLVTGQFPGDGKSKPIAFPSPEENVTVIDGIRCLGLPQMVQLKLASGTAKGRRRDLADVQDMIRRLELPENLREQFDPSVQDLYQELWDEVRDSPENEP